MRKTTPSEALSKIIGFIDRVKRLELDNYSDKRFKTQDVNKLKHEWSSISFWYSIAVFNKNKARSSTILSDLKAKHRKAQIWIENGLFDNASR